MGFTRPAGVGASDDSALWQDHDRQKARLYREPISGEAAHRITPVRNKPTAVLQ
jgi:hypothetical protein